MSSSASTVAVPFAGLYSAGKHAMAGYSEALRQEVSGFGLHVSYIEATTVRTQAAEEVMVASERIEAYSPLRDQAVEEFRDAIRSGMDPRIVARAVRRIIETDRPRLVYRVDGKAKLLPVLKAMIPQRLVDAGFSRYGRSRGDVQRDR